MRGYFKRLKEHPGVGFAFMPTLMIALAVAGNETVQGFQQGLIAVFVVSAIPWAIVLISNFKRKD